MKIYFFEKSIPCVPVINRTTVVVAAHHKLNLQHSSMFTAFSHLKQILSDIQKSIIWSHTLCTIWEFSLKNHIPIKFDRNCPILKRCPFRKICRPKKSAMWSAAPSPFFFFFLLLFGYVLILFFLRVREWWRWRYRRLYTAHLSSFFCRFFRSTRKPNMSMNFSKCYEF